MEKLCQRTGRNRILDLKKPTLPKKRLQGIMNIIDKPMGISVLSGKKIMIRGKNTEIIFMLH